MSPNISHRMLAAAGLVLVNCNSADGFSFAPSSSVSTSFAKRNVFPTQTNELLCLKTSQGGNDYDADISEDPNSSKPALDNAPRANYLEALALSVTIFFLATIWLSNGQIFSDFTSNSPDGKASYYKTVDATSVLEEDFNRASSSVIF